MKFILNAIFLGKCLPVIILMGIFGVNLHGQIKVDQNKSVGIGLNNTESVDASANFEIRALLGSGNGKLGGLLIPQVNNAQMLQLKNIPAKPGLVVYNTESMQLCYYAQSDWVCMSGTSGGGQSISRSGAAMIDLLLTNGGIVTQSLVPSGGTLGQVLTKTSSGYDWQTSTGGYTAGSGISINGSNVITNELPEATTVTSSPTINLTLTNNNISANVNNNSITPAMLTQSYLTSEIDGDTENEGKLSVGPGSANSSTINSNSFGSNAITIAGSQGISVTETGQTISILNTGDTDPANDLTTATNFGGDVSGVFNNLQLGANVVGANEIASSGVAAGSYTNANITVDADGRITTASNGSGGGGTVTGSGTLNYIPKWTPNGTTLGNSIILETNNSIGINSSPIPNAILTLKGRLSMGYNNAYDGNIFIGESSAINWTGVGNPCNVVIGKSSGANLSTANGVVLIGNLANSTNNHNCVSIGSHSSSNQDGVAIGGNSTNSGINAVAVGNFATAGAYTVAIGKSATGNGGNGVIIGYSAEGSNIAIGSSAYSNSASGIAIGYDATAGGASNCIAIGNNATAGSTGISNCTSIGHNATNTTNYRVYTQCGSTSGQIGGDRPWSIISDKRFKNNIQSDVPGLNFITKLRPVTYSFDYYKYQEHVKKNIPDSIKSTYLNSIKDVDFSQKQTGFIAQEVEEICKNLNYDFDGYHSADSKNEEDTYSIAYSQFVVPLVKAVQEQQVMIEDLKKDAENKNAIIEDLIRRIEQLERK